MVRVELYQSGPGELTGFRAVGHAGYAPPGEDIVCAGVSAVTQAAVLGLKDYLELPISLKAEDGLLECRLPRQMPEEKRESAKAILETMVLALREIEKGHGRYFALISLDAPRTSRKARGRRGKRSEGPRKPATKEAAAPERRAQEGKVPSEERQPAEVAARPSEERRRRKGWRRTRPEPARQNGVPEGDGAVEAVREESPKDDGPPRAPEREEAPPPQTDPEPEPQVAVAQEPAAESQKRSILNPFRRRRLRSFKPGRLGRRWRP